MTSDAPHLVVVARVVKAHGIRGEVACNLLTDVPDRLAPGVELLAGDDPVTVATSRPHQGRMLVRFDGVTDRTQAELLRGRELFAEPLEASDQDVYFVHELIGMAVRDDQGADLGAVRALVDLPDAAEYDLLEVERADGRRWLLPAVDDYVEIAVADDDTEYLVLVDPPEGLLEEDEPSDASTPGPGSGSGT